jgi:ADP-ribose pyrophosphatase YjhB (NUDIX family)
MHSDIRFVALGAVRREDELLVSVGESPDTGELYYRLLGGGVEFGEHSRDAVVREFEEELGVEFTDATLADTFERIFTFDGETGHEVWRVVFVGPVFDDVTLVDSPHLVTGHEVWRVYEGHVVEDWPYEHDSFTFTEPEFDTKRRAKWMPIEQLRDEGTTFYAPGVLDSLGV